MQIRYLPFFCVLLSAILVPGGDASGGNPLPATVKAKKCLFPKSRKRAPSWVCDAKADGFAVTAVGSAAKSVAGTAFMERMAAADARTHIAQNLSGSSRKSMTGRKKMTSHTDAPNRNRAERDSSLTTRVTDESLQGTRVLRRAYGPDGTLYVLVGLDETSAKKLNESAGAEYLQQKRK